VSARRVLVTGAGGFIGGRVVETLALGSQATPRALLRRWTSAARIARFPVEIRTADLRSDDLSDALTGCDAVVHCAVGDTAATVEGTQRLLDAAITAGARRVVHLSTVEVYGDASGEVLEEHALRPSNAYGRDKVAAEGVCEAARARGLEVAILRPAIVYGPFSRWWTERPAERLASGLWTSLGDDGQGLCNVIHVDDVVSLVLLALEHPAATTGAFNVTGPEAPTWNAYFQALNDALGLPPLRQASTVAVRLRTSLLEPPRLLARQTLRRFEAQVRATYDRSDAARGLIRHAKTLLSNTASLEELALFRRRVRYVPARATSLLGWRPRFDLAAGLADSVAWLRHEGWSPDPYGSGPASKPA
jgi:nucleoside-diphosphate-sugar epimerase